MIRFLNLPYCKNMLPWWMMTFELMFLSFLILSTVSTSTSDLKFDPWCLESSNYKPSLTKVGVNAILGHRPVDI